MSFQCFMSCVHVDAKQAAMTSKKAFSLPALPSPVCCAKAWQESHRVLGRSLPIIIPHQSWSVLVSSDDTSSRHAVDQDNQEHGVLSMRWVLQSFHAFVRLGVLCMVQRSNSCCGFFDLIKRCTVLVYSGAGCTPAAASWDVLYSLAARMFGYILLYMVTYCQLFNQVNTYNMINDHTSLRNIVPHLLSLSVFLLINVFITFCIWVLMNLIHPIILIVAFGFNLGTNWTLNYSMHSVVGAIPPLLEEAACQHLLASESFM